MNPPAVVTALPELNYSVIMKCTPNARVSVTLFEIVLRYVCCETEVAAAAKKKEAVIKERDVIELVRGSIGAPTLICRVTTVQNIPEFSEERNFLVNVQMSRFLTVQFFIFLFFLGGRIHPETSFGAFVTSGSVATENNNNNNNKL